MKTNAGERWFNVFFLPVPRGWNLYMLITYGWCCTEGASEGAVAMWKRLPSPHGKLKWALCAVGKIPSNNEEEEIDDATRPLWAQNHWNHWSCPAKVGLLFRNLISRRKLLCMKKKNPSPINTKMWHFSAAILLEGFQGASSLYCREHSLNAKHLKM